MPSLKELEKRIKKIEERNKRVEADKSAIGKCNRANSRVFSLHFDNPLFQEIVAQAFLQKEHLKRFPK